MANVKVNSNTHAPRLAKDGKTVIEPPKAKNVKLNRGFTSTGVPKRK